MSKNLKFRKAEKKDSEAIWKILQQAIQRRKEDGSRQWQDGYPNPDTVAEDIEKGHGYVLTSDDKIVVTAAVVFNYEPTYEVIDGAWLTTGDFLVIHRIGVSNEARGKGYVQGLFRILEDFAIENNTFSIKVDTNFDNDPMLRILEKSGYTYCGEIQVRDGSRKAFEKVLKQNS